LRRAFEMVQSFDKNKELAYAMLIAIRDGIREE
jgi:hypothetical protein